MSTNRIGLTTEIDALSAYPKRHNARELKLAQSVLYSKEIDDTFESAVVVSSSDNQSGAPLPAEAAAGAEIAFQTRKAAYEQHLAAVESTGTAAYAHPYQSVRGLNIPLDADVTDGATAVEITNGITALSPAAFTIGTDGPFFMEATVKIADVSDLEELWCGFRKTEDYQADPDSYTDVAAFHIGETGATVADGQVNLATILNDAATSYTDTTETDWADAGEHTLRVEVDHAGVVTFKFDGDEPATTAAFTFDDGDVVVPFLYADNTAGSTTGDPGVSVSAWRVGKL